MQQGAYRASTKKALPLHTRTVAEQILQPIWGKGQVVGDSKLRICHTNTLYGTPPVLLLME